MATTTALIEVAQTVAPLAADIGSATVSQLHTLAFLTPGPAQVIIVGMVVLLLFGNRLPSVMRSLGEGITEFKRGIKGGGETDPNANIEDHRDDDLP